MLADGLARGGRAEAEKRLADFWRAVSSTGNLPPVQRAVMERLLSFMPLEGSPVQAWFDALSRYFSPYDVNPLNINPLKDLIDRFVDFDALRNFADLQIFISATNVQTGRIRVFSREKITADVVMASACLPMLFRAVEIDGVPYWDGGYLGNPPIFPFFGTTSTEDVLVVQINPLIRHKTPTSSTEIMNRINEITFNSSLMSEYRAIEFVARLIDQGPAAARHRARANIGGSTSTASCWIASARIWTPPASFRPTTISSKCCGSTAAAPPAASSTSISTISACAARSICGLKRTPNGRENSRP